MRSNGTRKTAGFKRLTFVFFLLLAVSCKSDAEKLGIDLKLKHERLSNGLDVILVEDHTVPIVTYQTWFRVGSVDEHPGITGISHLFEHMMFKGTPKYGPKAFFQQLEAKGADVNAFTTRDYTVYYATFSSGGSSGGSGGGNLIEKVIDMESDRMQNLKLDEEVLNSERQVVFEERRMRTDSSPQGRMQEAMWQLAYRQHPYQWPVIGFPQDLGRITLSEVRDYFKQHYQPANAALVVVGDFDATAALSLIKKYYEPIPARARPQRTIVKEPEQREERRLVLYDSVSSERFTQAYHVTSAFDEDSYALDVLANILFSGTTSRGYRALVEEKQVALGVSGSNYTPAYPGLFLISGTMKNGVSASEAEEALDQVIREVQEKGVTEEEIRVAIKQLTVELVDSIRTPYGMGVLLGTVHTIFGEPDRLNRDISKYLKVKPGDVKRVAQKYLLPNNRSIVTLSPKGKS